MAVNITQAGFTGRSTDWIQLAQDTCRGWAVLNLVLNLLVAFKTMSSLTKRVSSQDGFYSRVSSGRYT